MLDHPEEETGAVAGEPRDSERVDVGARVNAIIEAAEVAADDMMRKAEQDAAQQFIAWTRLLASSSGSTKRMMPSGDASCWQATGFMLGTSEAA